MQPTTTFPVSPMADRTWPCEPQYPAISDISWEYLKDLVAAAIPSEPAGRDWTALKNNTAAKFFFRLLGRKVNYFLRNPVFGSFLDYPWEDLAEVFADQAVRNRMISARLSASPPSQRTPLSGQVPEGHHRAFNQLSCSRDSILGRVKISGCYCGFEEPVLLLGDDDWTSVALGQAGFRDITVLEADLRVISGIRETALNGKLPIRTVPCDLRDKPRADLIRDYRLIIFGSAYNLESMKAFLDHAFFFAGWAHPCYLFLNTYLMSFSPRGLESFLKIMADHRIGLVSFLPLLNVYQVSAESRRFLGLFFGFLKTLSLFNRANSLDYGNFPYFISDGMILECRQPQADSRTE